MSRSHLIVLSIVLLCLGCSHVRSRGFYPVKTYYTQADLRVIQVTAYEDTEGGKIVPKRIVCTEPSPDVAKAVADALDMGGGLTIHVPPTATTPEAQAEMAGAFSRSHAEAIAQLTQRLATIQLLRDGMFRACEAYANGAISDTTYSVLLSRYDDTMITMLLGELAAGNFGGTLAAIGTGASGSASAEAAVDRALTAQREAGAAEEQLSDAQADAAASPGDAGVQERLQEAQEKRDAAVKAAASSSAEAKTLTAVSGIDASPSAEIAGHLATMQRKYIENINFDAFAIACISALDRGFEADTLLAKECVKYLPEIYKYQADLLKVILERANNERDWAYLGEAAARLRDAQARLRELERGLSEEP